MRKMTLSLQPHHMQLLPLVSALQQGRVQDLTMKVGPQRCDACREQVRQYATQRMDP